MRDGSTAGFRYFAHIGACSLSVISRGDEGIFEVRSALKGPVLAEIPLTSGNDYHESESITFRIPDEDSFSLYFTYRGKGSIDFLSFSFN